MQLHHEILGQGFPVLILHGLFGSLDNWRSVAKDLSSDYQVISVDQRNHGRSGHHPEMNYPAMAEDVLQLMDNLQLPAAHLIGHSMGGKTAMELALHQPERIHTIVVVDVAPRDYPRRHDYILDALLALDLPSFETRHAMEEALAPSIPDRDVRRFLLKSVTRSPGGGFQWLLGLHEVASNYDAIGRDIPGGRVFTKPCLFIRGEKSDYIREEDEPRIRQMFPRAGIETIAGAGHWVHAEAPAKFRSALKNFLQEHTNETPR